eukprot:Em0004g1089a
MSGHRPLRLSSTKRYERNKPKQHSEPLVVSLLPVLTAFLRWAGGRYCSGLELECCSFSSEVNSFAFSTVVRNSVVLPVARNCFLVAKGRPATKWCSKRCSLAEESSLDMACSSSCSRSCRNTGCASPRTIFLCGNLSSFASFSPHITCQLCSKPYKEPRILPCLHSFCEQCLHKEIERSGTKQNMECPTCQRSITIPQGGVNAIPQNLYLGFEVDVAGCISKIGSDGEKSYDACIDGSMGPAVVFCCTCHHLLCKPCQDHHKRNKILQHHQMVGLDKESLKVLPSITKPITKRFCSQPDHEKEELEYYCETCQLLTCRDCLHKDHRTNEVCNIAKVNRDAMKEALVCAQEVTSKLTEAFDANDKMAEQVGTSRENATLIKTQAFEQLHQTIVERKKALFSHVEAISLSKITAVALQKEQLMQMQDEIDRYTEMTSLILQTHTDHEMVALGDLLPTELKATLKKIENVSLTPNQSSDIHVSLHTDTLIKELSIFGDVMDSSPSPSQSTWSSESVAKVKAELRPKSHDGAVIPGEVEDHGDGTYNITLTPQTAGPHQLLITMDCQHVQKSPCDLYVRREYSTLCNPEQVINCSGGPSGIAIHDSGDIYVSCWSDGSIHVFDQAGQQRRTIGSSGSGNGQFGGPVDYSSRGM